MHPRPWPRPWAERTAQGLSLPKSSRQPSGAGVAMQDVFPGKTDGAVHLVGDRDALFGGLADADLAAVASRKTASSNVSARR